MGRRCPGWRGGAMDGEEIDTFCIGCYRGYLLYWVLPWMPCLVWIALSLFWSNISAMKTQLDTLGLEFDWQRVCPPDHLIGCGSLGCAHLVGCGYMYTWSSCWLGGVHMLTRVLQVDSMDLPSTVQAWTGLQKEGMCVWEWVCVWSECLWLCVCVSICGIRNPTHVKNISSASNINVLLVLKMYG